MELQQVLNSIGLVLNIIGVVVLFFCGWPQPDFSGGGRRTVEDETVMPDGRTLAKHRAEAQAKQKRHKTWAAVALFLIAAGFGFQLWATWAGP